MKCRFCGAPLHIETVTKEIVWVDDTGGDVCPINSLDPEEEDGLTFYKNRPHERG